MVVPAWHIPFLKLPLSFWLATVGEEHIAEPVKCTGVRFAASEEVFTCFLPEKFMKNAYRHLESNLSVSLVGVELHTYEGYQYKGDYLSHRPCNEEEVLYQTAYMHEFTDTLAKFGFSSDRMFNAYFHPPFIALDFRVRQVFDQSPRIGTGGEIK